ncbi:MAG: crosslink repair DNA glycosylase YcaQ family protein [Elusimicrobiota bacterium]
MKTVPVEAVASFFLHRQHLDRPLDRPFSEAALTRFVEDAGGLQIDSINVVDRAHYLTAWSRFGPYDKAVLDRIVYEKRALVEYWAHAACLVAASPLSAAAFARPASRGKSKG